MLSTLIPFVGTLFGILGSYGVVIAISGSTK